MAHSREYDAVIVGAGPNGLAASITLAKAGCSVLLLEGKETIGGGTRTIELTLPGFMHDVCSAIHPVGAASPVFRSLNLTNHELDWVYSPAALAHPLDDGTAITLERSISETAELLGIDSRSYIKLMEPLAQNWEKLVTDLLGPLRLPKNPIPYMNFGRNALRSVNSLARSHFNGERAQALIAGLGAHSLMTLDSHFSASFALMLGSLGHAVGWPLASGGSQKIADALASCLSEFGGAIETNQFIESLDQLSQARVVLFDVTPKQLAEIAGPQLNEKHINYLRGHTYGPGVFKVDWALSNPIPWEAGDCARAATVHIGGTIDEIADSETAIAKGKMPEKPFVILAQQSLFDSTRAPAGKHTAWGYCHVPNGSTSNMTEHIESQIERFAPGFRDCVLARNTMSPADLEEYNPNYFGGDIAGGAQNFGQIFAKPAMRRRGPYSTGLKGLYLCSSSTPPGGGVHGMCGYHAALAALRQI
jgi:phytoene dehydrogenase-like protein